MTPPSLRPGLDLLRRFADDPLLDRLAVAVQLFEPRRELAGLGFCLAHQEIERDLGPAEPAGRVDARREPEGDCTFVDRRLVDACGAHERSETGSLRASELSEPGDGQCAVLVDERHDVGDRRERDEVEVPLEWIVRQRLEELEHDAGPAELRERVGRRSRGDHGAVRQLVARPVVIGDDDLQAEPPRLGDLVDRGDAAVDGEHEPVALVGELLERLTR